MWDLWWRKWHWDRFLPKYFGFLLSISFHRCSIPRKNEKKLIIFITELQNKSQDCGASVASAAGPFTTKKKHKPVNHQSTDDLLVHVSQHNWLSNINITKHICSVSLRKF
jgi:hypothetical protein